MTVTFFHRLRAFISAVKLDKAELTSAHLSATWQRNGQAAEENEYFE